jgi:hypothetical protein
MLSFMILYPEALQQKGWVIQSFMTSKPREVISVWDVNVCIGIVSQNRPISSVLKSFL